MKTVTLRGGSRCGIQVEVQSWQKLFYINKAITYAEHKNLKIDEHMSWRVPEEVYNKDIRGNWVYDRTINYKP